MIPVKAALGIERGSGIPIPIPLDTGDSSSLCRTAERRLEYRRVDQTVSRSDALFTLR